MLPVFVCAVHQAVNTEYERALFTLCSPNSSREDLAGRKEKGNGQAIPKGRNCHFTLAYFSFPVVFLLLLMFSFP